MKPPPLIIAVLTFAISAVGRQAVAIICQNGGTCVQKSGDECTSCSCAPGFDGADCGDVLMKVVGSVSFNTSGLVNGTTCNETAFQDRLAVVFPGYQNSTLEKRDSSFLSMISFVVYTQRPAGFSALNVKDFQTQSEVKLIDPSTTKVAFTNSSRITASSASVDIDECASNLYVCPENAECYNTDAAYGCTCKVGFPGTNASVCEETYCLLSQAPSWPTSASRTVTYPNGTDAAKLQHGDRMPYKTFIEYKCPERFSLVNTATGEAQTEVIECIGIGQSADKNNGWTGNDVRCDMTLQFMIAIVMASVSSVIIVLVGGAFVVSWTNEKKAKQDSDTEVLEMDSSVGDTPR